MKEIVTGEIKSVNDKKKKQRCRICFWFTVREHGVDGLQSGAQVGDKGLLSYLWPVMGPSEGNVATPSSADTAEENVVLEPGKKGFLDLSGVVTVNVSEAKHVVHSLWHLPWRSQENES